MQEKRTITFSYDEVKEALRSHFNMPTVIRSMFVTPRGDGRNGYEDMSNGGAFATLTVDISE